MSMTEQEARTTDGYINENLQCPLCKSRKILVKETRGGFRNRVDITCQGCTHHVEGWEDFAFGYFGGF